MEGQQQSRYESNQSAKTHLRFNCHGEISTQESFFWPVLQNDSLTFITLADFTLFSCQNVDNLRTACMVHQIKIVFVIRPVCPSRIKAQSNIIANQV